MGTVESFLFSLFPDFLLCENARPCEFGPRCPETIPDLGAMSLTMAMKNGRKLGGNRGKKLPLLNDHR